MGLNRQLKHWKVLALLLSGFVILPAFRLAETRLASAAIPLSAAWQDGNKQQTDDSEKQAQIEALIRQLGSSNFSKRQIAVEELWQFGQQAKEAIKRASKNGDPEVARRATELLTVLSMGIDSNTNPELANLILRFNGSERDVQSAILKNLLREQKLEMIFELLGQVESENDRKYLFARSVPLKSTISNFGRMGRWDEIKFILNHPMTFDFEPIFVVQHYMALNKLEPLIERLKAEYKTAEDDGKKTDAKALNRLISLLMMERRFDEAETYVSKIKKDSFRNALLNQILFEKGDWKAISQKLADEDDDLNDGKGLIAVTDIQRSLVANFADDEESYNKVVAKVLSKLKEAKAEKEETSERKWKQNLVEIGTLNLDWNLIKKHLDFESDSSFELLVSLRRIDDAFKLINLGDTVERRDLWFKRKMRYIQTLRAKIIRLKEKQEDEDPTESRLNLQWETSKEITNVLSGLGHDEEAVAYLHTLFENHKDEEHAWNRSAIIWQLIWMNRFEDARNLVKNGFRPDEYSDLVKSVFPGQKDSAAVFWYRLLTDQYPDYFDRLRAAAGIVNSPFCNLPDFDLDYVLASIRPKVSYQKSGYWDYQLAKVYEFHGREREFNLHMEVARQLGYSSANSMLLKNAEEEGDYDPIIAHYDTSPNNRTAYAALMAANAYLKKGDIQNAALRKTLAFSYWNNSYRTTSTLNSLSSANKRYLAADFLKLQLYKFDSLSESSITNENYRIRLGQSLLDSDPEQAVVHNRIFLFNGAETDDPGGLHDTTTIDRVIETELARAKALIAEGKLTEAADLMITCDKFAPGDAGIGETLLLELDKAGGKAESDRVFKQMSQFYFDILAKHPDSPLHHNNYAWLCVCARRKMDHMLRHAELAVANRPRNTSYLDTLAMIHFVNGDVDKAIMQIKECIMHYPTKERYRKQLRLFEKQRTKNQ